MDCLWGLCNPFPEIKLKKCILEMELKHRWQKRCTVVEIRGWGWGVLGGFAQILLSGVLGVARKSIVTPYFHVLLHFYDQGFQNVTPLPGVHLCVKESLKTLEPHFRAVSHCFGSCWYDRTIQDRKQKDLIIREDKDA